MLFLFFGLFCESALTFLITNDKPSMSMVSHKTIHSMARVGLEKNIGKTIDTNGWNLKNHWKTIETNGSHVKKTFEKPIDYNGTLTKTINHSIVVKILPSLRSNQKYLPPHLIEFYKSLMIRKSCGNELTSRHVW